MEKIPDIVKEYISGLNDDDLRYLHSRLDQKFSGDMAEALDLISDDHSMDYWLKASPSHNDFFNRIDFITNQLESECSYRNIQ
jgi:hypothetical protein